MKTQKNKGYTIVEVMIAAALLSVGIVSLVVALYSSYDLVNVSQEKAAGSQSATIALETLRGWKSYDTLYNNFSKYQQTYNGTGPKGPFWVKADGSIDWTIQATNAGAIGIGWFEFVTNENAYPADWGTATAFNTAAAAGAGGIDLDGNNYVWTTSYVTIGRTLGGTNNTDGRYMILPVTVRVRIFGDNANKQMEYERKAWLLNNYEE